MNTSRLYEENLHFLNQDADGPGDYIRLLRPKPVQKTKWREKLKGNRQTWDGVWELRLFSLAQTSPFAALSYSWGNQTQETSQYLYIHTGSRLWNLSVSQDLYNALARLAVANTHQWLWIDAICIDQTDNEEKNDQVQRMRSIYAKSACVLVWLGEAMGHYRPWLTPEAPNSTNDKIRAAKAHITRTGITPAKFYSLLSLGSSVWWSRLWVIQEITSSIRAKVLIGSQVMEWHQFVHFFEQIEVCSVELRARRPAHIPSQALMDAIEQIRKLDETRKDIRESYLAPDIMTLLAATSTSSVSNPRDRVYSLLGIATEEDRTNITIKYGATVAECFTDLVKHVIHSEGNINILFGPWPHRHAYRSLGEPTHSKEYMPNTKTSGNVDANFEKSLPTWLPNFCARSKWHVQPNKKSVGDKMYMLHYSHRYRALLGPKASVKFSGLSLLLDAIEVDRVLASKPMSQRDITNLKMHANSGSIIRGDELLSYLLKQEENLDLAERPSERSELTAILSKRPVPCRSFHKASIEWSSHELTSRTRFIFITMDGLVGLTSSRVHWGDVVIIPFGSSLPAIIRPAQIVRDEADTCVQYHLVDPCFVAGLMDGEILADELEDRVTVKTFEIV